MTNWRSGSLLLACALGLGTAGCGDDDNSVTDSGMDSSVTDSAVTDSAVTDAMMDTSVPPPNPALIRIAALPAGFPPLGGNPLTPQPFDICLAPGGGSVQIMATVDSFTTPTGERPLPVGAVTQHVFEAADLEMACGFPTQSTCTATIYRTEDVTYSLNLGTPRCNVQGNAPALATLTITPTTFTGSAAFTVAFIGDAAAADGAATELQLAVIPDERVATDVTKARVRIVNFDPQPGFNAFEVCANANLGAGQFPVLGNDLSSALQLGASAYANINPLAPTMVPDGMGGMMTVPLSFTAHFPDTDPLTSCNEVAPGTDGIPVSVWPPAADNTGATTALYSAYLMAADLGGATPLTSFSAGQVATIYLMRVFTGQPEPAPPTAVVAIPLLDSPIVVP